MRTEAYWYTRLALVVLAVAVLIAAMSCGGGGGTIDVAPGGNNSTASSDYSKGVGQLITEDEIASLPAWQQELLSDAGWDQPYIEPRAGTEVEAPTPAMLDAALAEMRSAGIKYEPRGTEASKGASWTDQDDFDGETIVAQGEYESVVSDGTPSWGCNKTSSPDANGHELEDVISAATKYETQAISYVLRGNSQSNWFNTTGGSGNDALSAVYQLFSSARDAIAPDWEDYDKEYLENGTPRPLFEELSYRADKAPGIGIGGDCSEATAYLISGMMWKKFNSVTTALPGLMETAIYNMLIAPSDQESDEYMSGDPDGAHTTGVYQPFYFGTVTACYGGAWIVGLTNAATGCTNFDDSVNEAFTDKVPFHYTPIYGVLLQRWQDMQLAGMEGAWENFLGWPVLGPRPGANGAMLLGPRGSYYMWGLWFERGFMWWLDYDQAAYPEAQDEAQVYVWTGDNVFCHDDTTLQYQQLAPTVFYGQGGDLGVTVVVDSFQAEPGVWTPVPLDSGGTYYTIPLPENETNPSGTDTVTVAMHAYAYGGTPNADCSYDWYTWAFRDGTIWPAPEATGKHVTHTYGSPQTNMEGVYVVRVQVVDSTDSIGYGDSLPIHLGHGAAGMPAQILVLRNDGGTYDANYDAIIEDLDTLGVGYAEYDYGDGDLGGDILGWCGENSIRVVIWYRGGPDAAGDPTNVTDWTMNEADDYLELMNGEVDVLLFSQNVACWSPDTFAYPGWYAWAIPYYGQWYECWTNFTSYGGTLHHATLNPFYDVAEVAWAWGKDLYNSVALAYYPLGAPASFTRAPVAGKGPSDSLGDNDGANRAENNTDGPASGKVPTAINFNDVQICCMSYYGPNERYNWDNGNFVPGWNLDPNTPWYDRSMGFISWGSDAAPMDTALPTDYAWSYNTGPAKCWTIGYPWASTTVTDLSATMTRTHMMQNVLAWLDDQLIFSGAGAAGGAGATGGAGGVTFDEYAGAPEIMGVTVGHWVTDDPVNTGGYYLKTTAYTFNGTNAGAAPYPDQTGTNVYRTLNAGDPAWNVRTNNVVYTASANNDWINGNDVDYQFPHYAYIIDGGNGVVDPGNAWVDDTVFFGGLLISDAAPAPNGNWARLNPALWVPYALGTAPYANVPAAVIHGYDVAIGNPPVNVAGYYFSLNGGDSGDEVRANYGTDPEHASIDNKYPVTAECIAHWNLDFQAAEPPAPQYDIFPVLYWSMYPGDQMVVPGTSTYIEASANSWDTFRYVYDIDPSVSPAARATGRYNRPGFMRTNATASGRVMVYNYRNTDMWNWNPDLNRDGSQDAADKFPIRVRLFTQYADYIGWAGNWPDHMQDPGSAPTGGTLSSNGDFIEGGAYMIDTGQPVYPMTVIDDPATTNPNSNVAGGSGAYTVSFGFIINYGTPGYTIQFELDPDNDGWGDADSDGGTSPIYPEANNGIKWMPWTNITLPDGNYWATVRVVDSNAPTPQVATYRWLANQVQLTPPYLLMETCTGYTNWNSAATGPNLWTRWRRSGSANTRWYVGTQFDTAYQSYTGMMFHCNNGTDGGNGNTRYETGYSGTYSLVSKGLVRPAGSNPYLYLRCYQYMDDYYSFSYTSAGIQSSQDSSTYSGTSYPGGTYTYWNYNTRISGYYCRLQTELRSIALTSTSYWPIGGTRYFRFSQQTGGYSWAGTAASGAHLDGIVIQPQSGAPPGW